MDFTRLSDRDATLATLAYADIFDYPLTRQELIHWMLMEPHVPAHAKEIESRKGYFFLKGRSKLVQIRRERKGWQKEKWDIAKRAARALSYIPTIQLVGVTGGLAMNNARKDDDIDLFLIVSDGTLWISRLKATILMDMVGLRRRPNDVTVTNKVCLNMFVTEHGMGVPGHERDCFSAHEVLQMQPLFIRGRTYRKFLGENQWVSAYVPVAWKKRKLQTGSNMNIVHIICIWILRLYEWPGKVIQLWYMTRHRTHEVITDTTLRFHPRDARVWIKKKLSVRLRRYNIPLDKIFYAS